MSRQSGSAFVNIEELSEIFNSQANEYTILEAPPIIEDDDLVFFKDENGEEYNVIMRGDRTRKGIYFKVKDIERVFEMNRLDEHIVDTKSSYQNIIHYELFIVPNPRAAVVNQHEGKRELYLTYKGLMRVMYRSNSGVAFKFQDWIDECVFALNWGTQEQKSKVAVRSLNVDADHLKAIMNKCPTSITCLYLIDIKISQNDRRVFKYGFTKNIRRRFGEHMKTYGDDIKLDTFIFIPELDLSKAETTFKQSISLFAYTDIEDKEELIILCDQAYINVQTIFSTIMDKYCGNMRIVDEHYMLKEMEYKLTLANKNTELATKNTELANKNGELIEASKNVEIANLKIQLLEMELANLRSQSN